MVIKFLGSFKKESKDKSANNKNNVRKGQTSSNVAASKKTTINRRPAVKSKVGKRHSSSPQSPKVKVVRVSFVSKTGGSFNLKWRGEKSVEIQSRLETFKVFCNGGESAGNENLISTFIYSNINITEIIKKQRNVLPHWLIFLPNTKLFWKHIWQLQWMHENLDYRVIW